MLMSGARDAYVFICAVVAVPNVGGPLRALVGMVNVGTVPISSLGTCLIGTIAALLMKSAVVPGWCKLAQMGDSSVCICSCVCRMPSLMASSPSLWYIGMEQSS